MNIIARLEYELAYYNSSIHRLNHYTTLTPRRVKAKVLDCGRVVSSNSSCSLNIHFRIYTLKKVLKPPLVLLFPSPPVPVTILWWVYGTHLLQSVSLLCFIIFFSFLAKSRYLLLFSLLFNFTLWSAEKAKQVHFFFFLLGRGFNNWPQGISLKVNENNVTGVRNRLICPRSSAL